jgi:N-acetylmuramoyl-L-alanine amidase
MKKNIFLFFLLFLIVSAFKCDALEIVYPKSNPVKINADSTFFIGSADSKSELKINDVNIKISPIGAFAQVVPLKSGINNFIINSGKEKINFIIERLEIDNSKHIPPKFIEYPSIQVFYTNADNVPLRMTPVDSGINRMSHLPKGVRLLINGEMGDFYRVYLNSKLSGWIFKSQVDSESKNANNYQSVVIKKIKFKKQKDFYIYEITLQNKIPFIIKEDNGLTLMLFNVEENKKFDINDTSFNKNIAFSKIMGYEGYYSDNKFIFKIRKIPKVYSKKHLKDIRIVIDAGHGGDEFGAIGCCGDKEKDINLAISKKLKTELEKRGANVFMTREKDVNISLKDRVQFAKNKDAQISLSIHANALPDGEDPNKNKGTSVYYYYPQAKGLAESILNSMTEKLNTENDRTRQASLALVRNTLSISVLVEVAYMINPNDYAMLLDNNFQLNCAKAIADGIENYLNKL